MDCFVVKGLARRGWLIHKKACWINLCSISLVMHSTHGYCSVLVCQMPLCRKTLMTCFMDKAMQAAPDQWLTCATTRSGSHTHMCEKILLHGMKSKSWIEFWLTSPGSAQMYGCSWSLLYILLRSLSQLFSFTFVQFCSGITYDTRCWAMH